MDITKPYLLNQLKYHYQQNAIFDTLISKMVRFKDIALNFNVKTIFFVLRYVSLKYKIVILDSAI